MNKTGKPYKNKLFGIIYKAICITNGKVYIGQTTRTLNERKKAHEYRAFKGDRRSAFQVALLEEGFENFFWESIATAETQEELDRKEKYYIKKYKSINLEYGYNSTDGGIKTVFNVTSRDKLSKALTGRKLTQATREKMSKSRKGVLRSNEVCEKISRGRRGIVFSESTRKKMSIAKKGKKRLFSKDTIIKMTNFQRSKSKFTENDIRQIKSALMDGVSCTKLGIKYGVNRTTISQIKNKKTWADIV